MDVEKLKASKNQEADIKTALEAVKKDNAYLFQDTQIPKVVSYTPGSGGKGTEDTKTRANEALRSIFEENKEVIDLCQYILQADLMRRQSSANR